MRSQLVRGFNEIVELAKKYGLKLILVILIFIFFVTGFVLSKDDEKSVSLLVTASMLIYVLIVTSGPLSHSKIITYTILLFVFSFITIGGILYHFYKQTGYSDMVMLSLGYTLMYLGIVLFIYFLNSRVHPIMHRILTGIITVCAIATPLYMLGRERQNETLMYVSMLFYGMGLVIFFSSVSLDYNITTTINCIRRKLYRK